VPRTIRLVHRLGQPETTLIASIGICFAAALLALSFGYSVALGAFIAGSLVAESGHESDIEKLVTPVRDVFAAIFFVSVGMIFDPQAIIDHWGAVIALTLAVILGNMIVVTTGAFLVGLGRRTSMRAGMSLAQIGEFSFIIAGVGVASGAIGSFIYPVGIAVAAITTLTTPLMIRASSRAAESIDQWLPGPLQTVAALYASWMERVRSAPRAPTGRSATNRVIRVILLDAVLLIAVVIGANLEIERVTNVVGRFTGLSEGRVRLLIALLGGLIIVPLMFGIVTSARALGRILASRAFPMAQPGKIDPADAPRRAMVIVVQMAVVIAVGVPVVAITQPFLPANEGAAVFGVLLLILFLALWRNAANLEGHARAGAQIIASALAHQMASADEVSEPDAKWLKLANTIVPGLGEPVAIRVDPESLAAGRSLASLNLRGATGATVLAIRRGDDQIPNPLGREIIQSGDLLAVAGAREALAVARGVLAPNQPRDGEPVSAEIEADIEAVNQVLRMRRV